MSLEHPACNNNIPKMKKTTLLKRIGCTISAAACMLSTQAQQPMPQKTTPYFIYPLGLTPNSDGKDDTWSVGWLQRADSFEVTINNRWGVVLLASNNPYFVWDGNDTKGKPVPTDMYSFTAVVYRRGESYRVKGNIMLVR